MSSGTLTPVAGSPFAAGQWVAGLAATQQYLFDNQGSLVSWRVDSNTGSLTQASSASASGGQTVTIDPSGSYVYTSADSSIYGFKLDAQNGQLTALPGSPYNATRGLNGAVISPDGSIICGSGFNGPGQTIIECERRDPATGAILSGPGNEFSGGSGPGSYSTIAFSPSGYLLVSAIPAMDGSSPAAGAAPMGVLVYRVSSNSLQQVSVYKTAAPVAGAALNRSANLLAVTDGQNQQVLLLQFNGSTGALTKLTETQTSVANPGYVAFTADGNYIAVSHYNDLKVSVYLVNTSTGDLQQVSGSPAAVTYAPQLVIGIQP